MSALVWAAWLWSGLLALLLVHTMVNRRLLRRPPARPSPVGDRVAVLLPVRDEAHRVGDCLRSLLHQDGVPGLEILVLDDGSTDSTVDVVRAVAAGDPRIRLLTGAPLPAGWLGKPYACHQLAAAVPPEVSVLIFVDADVVLAGPAVAAAVHQLDGFDLVSAYPRLIAGSVGERLIQPLLPWSWLTFLPLRAMERSHRPSLAAAGGQFLAVTRTGYDRAGGHRAVRSAVVEDVELARAVKRGGGRIALADFSRLARCRMYDSWPDLAAGYGKSFWAAVSPVVVLLLVSWYVAPVLGAGLAAALGAWALALPLAIGYVLGVAGRVNTGRATGGRVWPDALAHPASIVLLAWLVWKSRSGHRRGLLRWKGRTVA